MGYPNLGEADPGGSGGLAPQKTPYDLQPVVIFFFFQKKKQKAFVLLRRRPWAAQVSAKPTLGVWGRAPRKNTQYIFQYINCVPLAS
jgi:hypothetical protein